VDPSTLELLTLLVDQGPTARIMALFTCRPEFPLPWPGRAHLTQLTLTRLPRRQVVELVGRVTRGKALPAAVLEPIVDKTDGVPLFVEELTKSVLESGLLREADDHYALVGPLPPLAIPATLQDSLLARLDRLAPVREVAQPVATLGREFPYDLLRAVAPMDEATLQQALRRLVAAELLYQRGLPPQASYVFKHALIQDAAYASLLRSRRQQFHARIARVLVEQFQAMTETQPEVVAHHYTEAGLAQPAIRFWRRAGERAAARSANAEAVVHLRRGLALLPSLPETMEPADHRARQELALQLALGPALRVTQGLATREGERAYVRACTLARRVGDTRLLFLALWGLSTICATQFAFRAARELAAEALALPQAQPEGPLLVAVHRQLCGLATFQGELRAAARHRDQALAAYEPGQHQEHARLFGLDQGVLALAYGGLLRWPLGYPDQARAASRAAVDLARRLEHPSSLGLALNYACATHALMRDVSATRELAEAGLALACQHGQTT
jgi:predicted ATPase